MAAQGTTLRCPDAREIPSNAGIPWYPSRFAPRAAPES
jgi:hypothetical protein